MFARHLIFIALIVISAARGETIISESQQFAVHYVPTTISIGNPPGGEIEVVPQFLVVTAERIKEAVVGELPALKGQRSQIHIGVVNSVGVESSIGIVSSKYADRWRYEMAVPRVVEEGRLVKAFIDILLLEYANRGAERSAELPAWVTEGLAEQLLHSIGPKLVVHRSVDAWEASTADMNRWTRETLRTNNSPTFQELTTAFVPPPKTPGEALYLANTHLLVHSLLELPNGRQRFANFLQLLPRVWNWQTAFTQAFGFERMLDVEKWWSLTVIEFTTRDQRQAWSMATSLGKLEELLKARVEYRGATNELPEVRLVDLPSVMQETDLTLQKQELQEVIAQLTYTAPHMAAPVAAQAIAYKRTLETYLQRRDGNVVRPTLRSTPEALRQTLISDTLRRITALDEERRMMAERSITAAR